MKWLFAFTIFVFSISQVEAQKVHYVVLQPSEPGIFYGGFYFNTVKDSRASKDNIGIVRTGFFNRSTPAVFSDGFMPTMSKYFTNAAPKKGGLIAVDVNIVAFTIGEETESLEYAKVTSRIDYYIDERLVYSAYEEVESRGMEVTKHHSANIEKMLSLSVRHFDRSGWQEKISENEALDSVQPGSVDLNFDSSVDAAAIQEHLRIKELINMNPPTDLSAALEDKNTFSIGYQIGGFTLIGINYEIRVQDFIGLNFGGGFAGYTAGLKVHTSPEKNSSFFNASYKDGGFGQISTIGLELGGRLPFSKRRDFGLHYQAGFGRIQQVSPELADVLFPQREIPDYMFTIGVGFGW